MHRHGPKQNHPPGLPLTLTVGNIHRSWPWDINGRPETKLHRSKVAPQQGAECCLFAIFQNIGGGGPYSTFSVPTSLHALSGPRQWQQQKTHFDDNPERYAHRQAETTRHREQERHRETERQAARTKQKLKKRKRPHPRNEGGQTRTQSEPRKTKRKDWARL